MEITFENLPKAVTQLTNDVSELKRLLLEKNSEPTPEVDELLTIQQAGELLKLSVPTLYGYVQRSEIPVCKRRKRLYFSKLDLLAWIKQGRKKTFAETAKEAEQYCKTKNGGKL
jgi:excisionase family DNA binding protein